MHVIKRDGRSAPLEIDKIHRVTEYATAGLAVSQSEVEMKSHIMFFNGIKTAQIQDALIKAAAELISVEAPDYTYVAARLLLQKLYKEVTDGDIEYPNLHDYISTGVSEGRLNRDLLGFDLNRLDGVIQPKRDFEFTYLGLQTIYDRYLVRRSGVTMGDKGKVIELPQHFWMRVAMGLALNEELEFRTHYAEKFYEVLSTFKFVSSTPTLFNSGTPHSQMSSCYLNTVEDSIGDPGGTTGIFNTITECANLSKWAGGIGTDWTRVRPSGGLIKGTNGQSSGVVPYLKIWNDTAVAVNQGGRRAGSFAAYLEPWHPDIYRFIDLKKNHGDDRLRAREIFTAVWANDLFFERIEADGDWSLFNPQDHPELHETFGEEFECRYVELELAGKAVRTVKARELWRGIITALFESGGPWVTFKDECNRRNPQMHAGVVHNSNLCTEIVLNTSDTETAVCNLGSINLARCPVEEFGQVIPVAMRMLDNVIDLNFYPSEKARNSNMQHRPVGLGVMGWSELAAQKNVDWESELHLQLTDWVFQRLSYWAIRGSVALAADRGAYPSYEGSAWSEGVLPIDTARELPQEWVTGLSEEEQLEWVHLREDLKEFGIRNSNVMAIAPTATISNITGTTPCIEPAYKLVYMKENHSGHFLVTDPTLRYPLKVRKTAFDIDQKWVIRAAAVRQQWIDQAQSVNLFAPKGTRGSTISDWYLLAWKLGLKTTYYLRNQVDEMDHSKINIIGNEKAAPEFCSIENPDCEACQ